MRFLILSLILAWAVAAAVPRGSTQMLLVRTPDWAAPSGVLTCYERRNGEWWTWGAPIPVQVGRKGLGWGRGLHPDPSPGEPPKCEGDDRAPAGIFKLSLMFGSDGPPTAEFPYLRLTQTMVGVDDVRSRHYNEIVDKTAVQPDWKSSERMLIPDYRLGLVVDHNRPQAVPGRGSCIFMHLWETPETATSGCTVSDYASLLRICRWLRADAQPVLVQLPQSAYERLRQPWGLP